MTVYFPKNTYPTDLAVWEQRHPMRDTFVTNRSDGSILTITGTPIPELSCLVGYHVIVKAANGCTIVDDKLTYRYGKFSVSTGEYGNFTGIEFSVDSVKSVDCSGFKAARPIINLR